MILNTKALGVSIVLSSVGVLWGGVTKALFTRNDGVTDKGLLLLGFEFQTTSGVYTARKK